MVKMYLLIGLDLSVFYTTNHVVKYDSCIIFDMG